MTFQQELASWNPFAKSHEVSPVPEIGKPAPSVSRLSLPRKDGKPTIVAFLRHCGCPHAEKMFITLRSAAEKHSDSHFVAVSHSDEAATSNWLQAVGGSGRIEMIVDDERKIYGAYGLGLSSIWHALNPWSMKTVFALGKSENIWNRPTESGSRWQTAGLFGIDGDGKVEYAHVAQAADDLGDLENALTSLKR